MSFRERFPTTSAHTSFRPNYFAKLASVNLDPLRDTSDMRAMTYRESGNADDLRTRRFSLFKRRFEHEEKLAARNKQLVGIVKTLTVENLRFNKQVEALKARIQHLEDEMSRLKPLDDLLDFLHMSGERYEHLLNAQPVDTHSDEGERESEERIADKVVVGSQELVDRLLALLQSCADDEDELVSMHRKQQLDMVKQALLGDSLWKDHLQEDRHGTVARQIKQADEPDNDPIAWLPKGTHDDEDDDEFAHEIMAVGTELQLVCKRCGKTFTEGANRDTSCRQHPGLKQLDASWNSIWSCCRRRIDAPGCVLCKHERAMDEDVESASGDETGDEG